MGKGRERRNRNQVASPSFVGGSVLFCGGMVREIASDSWFGSWKLSSWKVAPPEIAEETIGVLACEVASLMSKVVNLWQFLSEREIRRSREDILRSVGIRKLVSDDEGYLMDLALNEIMLDFGLVSKAVGRLARKCTDPVFARFELFVSDPMEKCLEWYGWQYRLKKMERKVKKMERFIGATMQLNQEIEVLAELEQTLRRMQANPDSDRVRLNEFQQKVTWQRQEVKNLREASPGARTYDYIVRLLARSLVSIFVRIKLVFECNQLASVDGSDGFVGFSPDRPRNRAPTSAIYPSESILCGISAGSLGKSAARPLSNDDSETAEYKQLQHYHQPSLLLGKLARSRSKRLSYIGPLTGWIMNASDSPTLERCDWATSGTTTNMVSLSRSNKVVHKLAMFNLKPGLLNPPPSTLGHAVLALHYAQVIVLIERLASTPHMIDCETRDTLYNMLPRKVRAAFKARLKPDGKMLPPSAYKSSIAAKWKLYIHRTLEWISTLAHNMIRWQSERNFGKDQKVSGTNVLLVQTLYFADQAKTESVITELLVGLNYIYWVSRKERDVAASSEYCKDSHGYVEKRYPQSYHLV